MTTDTGRVLAGRYRLEEVLGAGGMAQVFRGTDEVLGRTVAVKVLSSAYASDERFVERFRREAQAAAALSHPNVVGVFDSGSENGIHYIVMEHVEGRPLSEVLEDGPVPVDRAVEIARAVCNALEAAHARDLVHRDVKPGNIMLTAAGEAKVMDFGIARAATDHTLTQPGTVMGTAAYISPEQARGDRVGPASDLYSLGCVLYAMLTGKPPFTADSAVALATKHTSEKPVPPSKRNPEVPKQVEKAVLKAMAKEPARRYGTASEMRAALEGANDSRAETAPLAGGTATEPIHRGEPPLERTAVLPEPAGPASGGRRPPWRWALLAAVALALAGLGFLLASLGEPERVPLEALTPSPPESPTPPASPDGDLKVGPAVAAISELVLEAQLAGRITPQAAEQILKEVNEALEKFVAGDLDGALERLGKAGEEVDKQLENGQISSPDLAEDIHGGLADLETAMLAEAPVEADEDEEGQGGGNGGNGKGKGGGKGNGDD